MPRGAILARLLLMAAALVACSRCAWRPGESPAAVPRPASGDTAWLAGVWRGTVWETPSSLYQGVRTVTLTFKDDGTWTAIDSAGQRAAGDAVVTDGRVILKERSAPHGLGPQYTLMTRDRRELWGIVWTAFGGRTANAIVDLKRVP